MLFSCRLRCDTTPCASHGRHIHYAHSIQCACACAQVPHGSARAVCLSATHQVDQFDPVHRARTSAPNSFCVMCSAANVRDWAYWEKELEHCRSHQRCLRCPRNGICLPPPPSAPPPCPPSHSARRLDGARRTCYGPSLLTSLCAFFRRAPGGSAS